MKFTLSWLREHLDTEASLEEIVDALNAIGLEVEEVDNPAERLKPFSVARIVACEPHPNADRLKVCRVQTGEGEVQVVCGAPNAREGLVGIFAPPGSHIPGTGLDLKVARVRGVESAGMMCSERELELSDDHEGIIELPEDVAIGTPAAEALGVDDPVIEIAITPNRGDALGVRGIARDLAARGLGELRPLEVPRVEGRIASPISVSLDFPAEARDACPHFIGRYIRGVRNGPSPEWMQRRLRAIGLRPISALVDITNYIMFTYNRPLHVFDADRITGDIHARLARKGERILALDGREYELDETMTVIADDAGPEGIAGIIGGERSGVTEETTNVFLEVAYFDPVRTAMTGRKLNIMTDARYRFERGVDPAFLPDAAAIATQMILDICGGEASEIVEAGAPAVPPEEKRTYFLRGDRVKTLGGLDLPLARQKEILEKLGFATSERDGGLSAVAPTWRPDIRGEADLVEEIVRIEGLDRIPSVPMSRPHAVARPVLTEMQKRIVRVRHALAARGLAEAVTYSFLPHRHAELFGGGKRELQLANPISTELSDMRPSLLPNLIAAAGRNAARGIEDIALFEVGSIYLSDTPEGERPAAAGVRQGMAGPRHWLRPQRPVDVFDAKADALAVLEAAGAPVASVQTVQGEAPSWFHPGRSGTLKLGPKVVLGHFGEIHPAVLEAMDVKGPVAAFEIRLDAIPERRQKGTARPPLQASDLMPLSRDFAFVVDADVPAGKIVQAARGADRQLIADVRVFDMFAGEKAEAQLGAGKKSVAIEVIIQPRERSLTSEEIQALAERIVAAVQKATGAQLRA
jgi:phenylalanyl-tRNA synthetase beta chain